MYRIVVNFETLDDLSARDTFKQIVDKTIDSNVSFREIKLQRVEKGNPPIGIEKFKGEQAD